MLTASSIATGIGVLFLAFSLPFLFDLKATRKRFLELLGDEENMLIISVVRLLISFLILSTVWRVTKTWEGLVALLGWLVFLKALAGLWFPEHQVRMAKRMLKGSESSLLLLMFIVGLIGVGLGYLGLYVL